MAPPKTKALPAKRKTAAAAKAEKVQTTFVDILKTDHSFDLIKEIVAHMATIKRAKRIKPQEKHRLLSNYYLTLLSYAQPRLKVVQDDTNKNATPMRFVININGTDDTGTTATTKDSGVSVTIPTNKNPDGSFSVD